ncbi:MAG: PHP domain-containing protein [Bifidobacteriaceae bacterium]|jgi:predicted metal-dependent phosphoesterase TrpH|nr:PHP domain-containing protein [Bifidobacteriaceae bacterium]
MRIDLHAHSSASDGTETPAEVMAQAKAAGLDVVALTDHDSTAGWDEAATAAASLDLGLVRGTEVSARSHGITVHLLSYLHDPSDGPLAEMLSQVRNARWERAQAMVMRLAADFPIRWADVAARASDGRPVGRPHIADELVAQGVVANRAQAFDRLLHPSGPYYVRYGAIEAEAAVEMVRQAGGVPVFAHPGATGRQRIVSSSVIERMADAGLAGLEVRHRDNPPEQRRRLRDLAQRLGLFETGSSDYHGAGKPNRLGENLTSAETLAEIIRQGHLPLAGGGQWAR